MRTRAETPKGRTAQAVAMLKDGRPVTEIAAELGMASATVTHARDRWLSDGADRRSNAVYLSLHLDKSAQASHRRNATAYGPFDVIHIGSFGREVSLFFPNEGRVELAKRLIAALEKIR